MLRHQQHLLRSDSSGNSKGNHNSAWIKETVPRYFEKKQKWTWETMFGSGEKICTTERCIDHTQCIDHTPFFTAKLRYLVLAKAEETHPASSLEKIHCGRISETVKKHLNQIFARFEIPEIRKTGDRKKRSESPGIEKMESTVHHPKPNGLAERAVQTVNRSLQAWSPNLNVSFWAFM